VTPIFRRLKRSGFNLRFTYHADAILLQDFSVAVGELDQIVGANKIPVAEIVGGGGGEALGTQRLRRALHAEGWRKGIFRVEKKINDRTTFAQSHEIDHVKEFEAGTIALEIEWNNKDPFFDRDLENFGRLHADGAISVGVIVTRGDTLQAGIEERIRAFALHEGIVSFENLERFGVVPTSRQRRGVSRLMQGGKRSFPDAWAACFVRDKFGTATTHWTKLESRLDRGVGSPCPVVAVGIPLTCITD
jgi:hypothetical protein